MYSSSLQTYVSEISAIAEVDPATVSLLDQILACYLMVMGRILGAETYPPGDLLRTSLQLLLLDDGLARLVNADGLEGAHYLVGLGLEQTGELSARFYTRETSIIPPVKNDHWYRLTLAFLNYLAGGHRVQALSVLRHLERLAGEAAEGEVQTQYQNALQALDYLYRGKPVSDPRNLWGQSLFGDEQPSNPQQRRIHSLAQRIRQRRDTTLIHLGRGNETTWLSRRGIDPVRAAFWASYLTQLETRGIVTFTNEQVGPDGFDAWLYPGTDLLVVLPTGAGKTIIGELRSALALAEMKQVLWMLPTRALVRQTKRGLETAFGPLQVEVDELPTTADYFPLFSRRESNTRRVAATTPERLAALLRANPGSVENVGLVVLDEAQILQQEGARAVTAEHVLKQIRNSVPDCDVILMSAFGNATIALDEWLTKLGRAPVRLVSDIRPTRHLYGIVTNEDVDGKSHPSVLLFPPGIQRESGQTENPFKLVLTNSSLPKSQLRGLPIAASLVKELSSSGLRTVLFVTRKDSTETQAQTVISSSDTSRVLPRPDIARLRIELGRESIIEHYSQKGVAPHHAGLCPLEQNIVEKWVRNGIVNTVVATPTLAQGVNLPFDLSIVSFTSRFDETSGGRVPLTEAEILNMLGRAGRAGYVSDGLCLLALRSETDDPRNTLDAQRRIFFRPRAAAAESVGLSRLVRLCVNRPIDSPEWLIELGGLEFSEVQGLVSFSLDATEDQADVPSAIHSRLMTLPSVQMLEEDEVRQAVASLANLVKHVRELSTVDQDLPVVVQRTGLPVEVLRYFLSELRSRPDLFQLEKEQLIKWADRVVLAAIKSCHRRQWCIDLFRRWCDEDHGLEGVLDSMFVGIRLWRNGTPLGEIEGKWRLSINKTARTPAAKAKHNRIAVGSFFNHDISLIAQFWGALAVCAEILFGDVISENGLPLYRLQTFVREGVSSIQELVWLKGLGGMDRVLAHRIAAITSLPDNEYSARESVRSRIRRWKRNPTLMRVVFDASEVDALQGAIDELEQQSLQI